VRRFRCENVQVKSDWRAASRTVLGRAAAFARSAEPRPVVSRRAVLADGVLAAAAAGASALTAGSQPHGPWLVPLLLALTAVPLAWRRVFPLTAFWVSLAVVSVAGSIGANAGIITFLAVTFAAYSAVVYSRFRGAALISMLAAAVFLMAKFQDTAPPISPRATPLLIFIPIMIVGDAVHMWRRRAGDSQARLRRAQAEHQAATRRALELERGRIASELHDVVTHNVSVMVVQAGAARQVLVGSPADARQALLAVEASGRAALTELRHLLGLLSPVHEPEDGSGPGEAPGPGGGHAPGATECAGDAAALQPQPGLATLRSLIDRAAAAGLPVELDVQGRPQPLPPGLDLAAYRVAQEALTNVIKHAGRPITRVTVCYRPDELVVRVTDDGPPIPAAAPASQEDTVSMPAGAGRGLLGLRERVALYGGHLDAGRRREVGWEVRATIPLDSAEVPAGSNLA
jgi:signal transduction histidine kinase